MNNFYIILSFTGWLIAAYLFIKQQQSEKNQKTMQAIIDELGHKLTIIQDKYLITQQSLITNNMQDIRNQLQISLKQHSSSIDQPLKQMINMVENKLQHISQQVDFKLDQGFNKTNTLFNNVIKRLAEIDAAQQRIQNLSENIIDLKNILNDKSSRGAFGEVQLHSLIKNMVPEQHFKLQHTLSNGKRADCLLLLPLPTGNIAIDAKFPLESYQKLINTNNTDANLKKQFKQDITHHIQAIREKYIIPNETSDGAIMFIPAEAIFAFIHSSYPDLINLAHKSRVWIASPSTMMAILTTATGVLKDLETSKQVTEIQNHLVLLSKDFTRFQKRMEQLTKHIEQAHNDVLQVNTSSAKISKRFFAIENVELNQNLISTE